MALENQWKPGWAYDGRKSMHAPGIFLPQERESVYEAQAPFPMFCCNACYVNTGVFVSKGRPSSRTER